ncbi:hypothetical protein HanLR1_Chr15g0587761 [Helianthus annuus]|nr:hypothetical protein HanLR1_Chr15g0587761 [Helianthus annuus]
MTRYYPYLYIFFFLTANFSILIICKSSVSLESKTSPFQSISKLLHLPMVTTPIIPLFLL